MLPTAQQLGPHGRGPMLPRCLCPRHQRRPRGRPRSSRSRSPGQPAPPRTARPWLPGAHPWGRPPWGWVQPRRVPARRCRPRPLEWPLNRGPGAKASGPRTPAPRLPTQLLRPRPQRWRRHREGCPARPSRRSPGTPWWRWMLARPTDPCLRRPRCRHASRSRSSARKRTSSAAGPGPGGSLPAVPAAPPSWSTQAAFGRRPRRPSARTTG
mmetsp:Transcript_2909/g.9001  ORF Transcript_2909/g.9001 Transcript_2909/m.9001 type:complete len:211 (-) Transcript_2909:579-1211(-)